MATDPAHQSRGLATALSSRCVQRLIEIGYDSILVQTGDDLLGAIRIYLRLGFEPMFYEDGMKERWQAIYQAIGMPWPDNYDG